MTVIKAMTAVGRLKPKYPFLTVKTSALIYVAFYLKGKGNNMKIMPRFSHFFLFTVFIHRLSTDTDTMNPIFLPFYFFLAFNHKSPTYIREIYKKKLALFEENCALIPYLCSSMRGNYKPPSERPLDYEFKLHKFLALRNVSGKSAVL